MDPVVMGNAVCHFTHRQPFQLAKADLLTDPLLNNFSRMNKAVFIRRTDNDETALEQCKQLLNEGEIVVVFPEGTLGPGDGKLLDFKSGAIRLAYECDVPIIPAAIYGSDKIFGKDAKTPKNSGKLRVKFGEPLTLDKLFKRTAQSDGAMKELDGLDFTKATNKVQKEVEKLWTDLSKM
jgi:1-acyl-sn-glycerol-3-phosphate acyltransferase